MVLRLFLRFTICVYMRHYIPFYHSSSTFLPRCFTLSLSLSCTLDSLVSVLCATATPWLQFILFHHVVCVLQAISFLNRLFHINQFSTTRSSSVLWKYEICWLLTVDFFFQHGTLLQRCDLFLFLVVGRRQRSTVVAFCYFLLVMDETNARWMVDKGLLMLNSWEFLWDNLYQPNNHIKI